MSSPGAVSKQLFKLMTERETRAEEGQNSGEETHKPSLSGWMGLNQVEKASQGGETNQLAHAKVFKFHV